MDDQRRFHNALRLLMHIDGDEFLAAGGSKAQWNVFKNNPFLFYIRAGDELENKLWALIESGQPKQAS